MLTPGERRVLLGDPRPFVGRAEPPPAAGQAGRRAHLAQQRLAF
jgi:hypothetical protein